MNNDQMSLDYRKVITGKDGQLFISASGYTNLFLGEVDTFQAQLSISNTDLQPVGSIMTYAVPISISVNLTLSEIVVRDDLLLKPIIDAVTAGTMITYDFAGKLNRQYDSTEERIILRNCIPDGSVDLINLTPGDIVKRSWSFRVNALPEIVDYFKSGL